MLLPSPLLLLLPPSQYNSIYDSFYCGTKNAMQTLHRIFHEKNVVTYHYRMNKSYASSNSARTSWIISRMFSHAQTKDRRGKNTNRFNDETYFKLD